MEEDDDESEAEMEGSGVGRCARISQAAALLQTDRINNNMSKLIDISNLYLKRWPLQYTVGMFLDTFNPSAFLRLVHHHIYVRHRADPIQLCPNMMELHEDPNCEIDRYEFRCLEFEKTLFHKGLPLACKIEAVLLKEH